MKFICEKKAIVKEISMASNIIESKNTQSVLSNVCLEVKNNKLIIKSTDLKISFISEIEVEMINEGSVLVFCGRFLTILRGFPEGEIEFTQKGSKLNIKSIGNKIKFSLVCEDDIGKYPDISDMDKGDYFDISQIDIKEMIDNTLFSISDDESRYFMAGVLMEKFEDEINMVATDGKRLSFISKKIKKNKIIEYGIIPGKTLNILKNLLTEGSICISIKQNKIYFSFDNVKLISSLIEGTFPNYKKVIPEKFEYEIIVNKEQFKNAIERVSLIDFYNNRKIIFNIQKGKIIISATEEMGNATEEIICDYDSDEIKLCFNYDYFLEPLAQIKEDDIIIEFTGIKESIILKTEKNNFFHVIMPMMPQDNE